MRRGSKILTEIQERPSRPRFVLSGDSCRSRGTRGYGLDRNDFEDVYKLGCKEKISTYVTPLSAPPHSKELRSNIFFFLFFFVFIVEVLHQNNGDVGIKSVSCKLSGDFAYLNFSMRGEENRYHLLILLRLFEME